MTDFLVQFGVSNLCFSLALAVVAGAVHMIGNRPLIAHLLWVLVLVKLVTPPILTIPVVPVPGLGSGTVETLSELAALETLLSRSDLAGASLAGPAEEIGSNVVVSWIIAHGKTSLILLWVLGSVWVLVWSLVRIFNFNRLLGTASREAAQEVQRIASEIGQRLGLRTTPTIYTTTAHLSPMVWWIGGRVRIVIPEALPREMDADQFRWILAHELAHVRRRDHMVRWLEWLACVGFWWNPVAWLARRNLRINEEVCCDALVLSKLKANPHTYADSLMTVVEYLAAPALRPPAIASEINSGGFLERRFRMIVSKDRMTNTPRWLQACILVGALGLMPIGLAYGQNYDAIGRRLGEAVRSGELTREQAGVMLDALRKSAQPERRRGNAREEYERAKREIRKAVEVGRISGEDARKRLAEMREHMVSASERGRGAMGESGGSRAKITPASKAN